MIDRILNHTLAKEVARQVVELASLKTDLAEEQRKREAAEKKLKEPVLMITKDPHFLYDANGRAVCSAAANGQHAYGVFALQQAMTAHQQQSAASYYGQLAAIGGTFR